MTPLLGIINNLLYTGMAAGQILNFIGKKIKGLQKGIEQARTSGYDDNDILKFISGKMPKGNSSQAKQTLNDQEQYLKNAGLKTRQEKQESKRKGISAAINIGGVALAGYGLYKAYAKRFPKGEWDFTRRPIPEDALEIEGQAQKQLPYNPGMEKGPIGPGQFQMVPQGNPIKPQPSPGAMPMMGNPIQPPQQLVKNALQPTQSVPVPGANQPIQPPLPKPDPKAILDKMGLTDKVNIMLSAGNSPEQITAGTTFSLTPGQKDFLKKNNIPLDQVISEYVTQGQQNGTQPTSNQSQGQALPIQEEPQEQRTNPVQEQNVVEGENNQAPKESKKENGDVVELPNGEKINKTDIPHHLKFLFNEASKIVTKQELRNRMFVGTQEAFGDRDIQRIGRLIKSKNALNAKEFSEQFPHEWKDSFKQYDLDLPKFGNNKIVIWRAAPKDKEIESGDFVSLAKNYAQQHLDKDLNRNSLIRKIVNVDDVVNDSGDANEWIYAPKKDRDFMGKFSVDSVYQISRKNIQESKKENGDVVQLPNGEIGTIESIKKDHAIVEVDGKRKPVKLDQIEDIPIGKKDLADLHEELIRSIEGETEAEVSRNVMWAGYDPDKNRLQYLPWDGAMYTYDDIPPSYVERLTNILAQRKTTGKNFIGMWKAGTKSPIGAEMSKLIQELQKERGGKGKEYSGKAQAVYSAYEPAIKAAKAKKKKKK